MMKVHWIPSVAVLGAALLTSSCAEATSGTDAEQGAAGADTSEAASSPTPAGDPADASPGVAADGDSPAHDLYAPPLPPAGDSPPIRDYTEAAIPQAPFDHEPAVAAFKQALAQGEEPDETGLILVEEALGELQLNGETFTVTGVIDPGSATPLYENERFEGGVRLTPLIEELTGIPWPERRQDVLRGQATETACGGADKHLWSSFDTAEDPTCFEESGGVVDPYFRTISAVCQTSEETQARSLYMGHGGSDAVSGGTSGWDVMYRSPRLEESNSCYVFTVPVRGAVASLANAPG